MAKRIDERIEHLSCELEGLDTMIEILIAGLKRKLEHPTGMNNFAHGGGQLDVLLAKKVTKEEELKALQRMAKEERENGRKKDENVEMLMNRHGLPRAEAEEVMEGLRQMIVCR